MLYQWAFGTRILFILFEREFQSIWFVLDDCFFFYYTETPIIFGVGGKRIPNLLFNNKRLYQLNYLKLIWNKKFDIKDLSPLLFKRIESPLKGLSLLSLTVTKKKKVHKFLKLGVYFLDNHAKCLINQMKIHRAIFVALYPNFGVLFKFIGYQL